MNEVHSWNLSGNDLKVLSAFYNKDFELLQSITDYTARMLVLFSKATKDTLIHDTALSYNTFNNSLSKLRKKGIINRSMLHEQLLFNLDSDEFNITIKIKDESRRKEVIGETSQNVQV